jgi:hypothetical protein
VTSVSPGVRRLCVGVGQSPLLDTACRIAGFGRLYTEHARADAIDLGFASPGVDEAELVADLISALHAAFTRRGGPPDARRGPVLVAFHVGITRVEGDDLRGAAVTRIREILLHLACSSTEEGWAEPAAQSLVVAISAGLFEDIRADCGFGEGWRPLPAADAWFRGYQANPAAP